MTCDYCKWKVKQGNMVDPRVQVSYPDIKCANFKRMDTLYGTRV